ncbi:MAG: NAD(P)/FAD-dependent oxidoreductase [bacterium]
MECTDVVVIGAGPAGIAAAIQLKRYGISPILFEKDSSGGLLRNAHLVENYPGFPNGIGGMQLVRLFEKQLTRHGVMIQYECVRLLDFRGNQFFIATNEREIGSRFVIVASGTIPKQPTDVTIPDSVKSCVFNEVYPIANVQNKKIAIIGAGDAAFDYALHLSENNSVFILNRDRDVKCLPLLKERSVRKQNIIYLQNVRVKKLNRLKKAIRLYYSGEDLQEEVEITVDYLLFAVGREPCVDFLTKELIQRFKQPNLRNCVYFVGDVHNGLYRQTAIAVGEGIKAAMNIYQDIQNGVQ